MPHSSPWQLQQHWGPGKRRKKSLCFSLQCNKGGCVLRSCSTEMQPGSIFLMKPQWRRDRKVCSQHDLWAELQNCLENFSSTERREEALSPQPVTVESEHGLDHRALWERAKNKRQHHHEDWFTNIYRLRCTEHWPVKYGKCLWRISRLHCCDGKALAQVCLKPPR